MFALPYLPSPSGGSPGPKISFSTSTITCKADCFIDGSYIRPIEVPNGLVWRYFAVISAPAGTLEDRQFLNCPCNCGNLIANPPWQKNKAPSLIKPITTISATPAVSIIKVSWYVKFKQAICRWIYRWLCNF